MTEYEDMHIQDNLRNGGGDLIICDFAKRGQFFLVVLTLEIVMNTAHYMT
jgi:hypothetical protein